MKRFTGTEKWKDSWFRKLKPAHKAFWELIRDECDLAGVWKVDIELASFYVGEPLNEAELKAAFGDRIREIGRGRWWVPSFIVFQYGKLSDRCEFHVKVLKCLEAHRLMALWEAYLRDQDGVATDTPPPTPTPTPVGIGQGEGDNKEEDKEVQERGCGEKPRAVELPKTFPTNETTAIDWARVGGCRATDEQIRLFWNEAAARNGTDVTGQPITRWVQHCNARAIRNEGRAAESKASGNKIWAMKTQLDAIEREMKKIEARGYQDAMGMNLKQEDRPKYKDLKKRAAELNDQIAKGGA